MSYFQYSVNEYSSSPITRTYRSSSVERSSSSYSSGISRFNRAATVGPCTAGSNEAYNVSYYGYMPFNRSLVDIENRIKTRHASSIARSLATPEPVNTYRRAYHTYSPHGGYSTYDYKVHDYASHLDNEETTRSYLNSARTDFYGRRAALGLDRAGSSTAERYRSDVDTRDLYTYKHYRKSNATLEDRNARAKSPILGRELDRYYKTERRSDYLGDISSGGVRDFRHYNYRSVPYFGGSDYSAYVPRIIKTWNNEIYPWYLPSAAC